MEDTPIKILARLIHLKPAGAKVALTLSISQTLFQHERLATACFPHLHLLLLDPSRFIPRSQCYDPHLQRRPITRDYCALKLQKRGVGWGHVPAYLVDVHFRGCLTFSVASVCLTSCADVHEFRIGGLG